MEKKVSWCAVAQMCIHLHAILLAPELHAQYYFTWFIFQVILVQRFMRFIFIEYYNDIKTLNFQLYIQRDFTPLGL